MREISAEAIYLNLGLCNNISELKAANRTIRGSMIPLSSKVLVYATSITKEEQNSSGSFPQDRKLHTVQYQTIPSTRFDFIVECSKIFVQGETLFAKTRKQDVPEKVYQISQQYQKQLLKMSRENQGKEAALFAALHGIWQLAQITCFDTRNQQSILGSLSEWIRINFTADLVHCYETVTKAVDPTTHPKFWKIINECIMRGYFDPANQLLANLHQDSSTVKTIGTLTAKYPKSEDYPTNAAFKQAWYKWHQDALFAFENFQVMNSSMEHHDRFVTIFSILAGVEEVIVKETDDWHNSLLGLVHFVSPSHDVRNLSELTNLVKANQENILDQIQIALLEQDIGFVVGLCSQFDWWLASHLVSLLDRMNLLELDTLKEMTVREWYLQSFAEYVLTEKDLRFVALEYFLACPKFGKESLAAVIPCIPLKNEDAERMIEFCKSHGLKEILKQVLTNLGKQALDLDQYEKAILYYLESDNYSRISFIIEKLLLRYETEGDDTFAQVASKLPTHSLFKSPALAFLSRYNEFRNLYQNQKYGDAAELVYMLFSSGSVPKPFWKMLLLDTLPLLEGQLAVFTTDQVMELMRCVEQCNMESKTNPDETFGVLKLALARSLAASLV